MVLTTAKWTIEEYHRMITTGILDERRVELLKREYLSRLLGDRAADSSK